MFEKFKEEDSVKVAAAVLLHDIIISDNKISSKEVEKFHSIFTTGFDVSQAESESLYKQAIALEDEFESHLEQISDHFKIESILKMNLIKVLNDMVLVDGIVDIEYERFETIKNALM